MRKARVKWSISALAVLLNVLGSPMAWAQWLDTGPASHAAYSTDIDSAPCHDGEMPPAGEPARDAGSASCCEAGSCTCAASALFVYLAEPASHAPRPPFFAPADTSTLPAHPLDDTLRPPIR
jgi:hypothetical protein